MAIHIHVKLSPEEKRRQLEGYVRDAQDGMDVYRHFLGDVRLGKKYRSPIPGHVDKHPSFNVFRSERDGMIWWKDHALEGGNCWKFVQMMLGCEFGEAVRYVKQNVLHLPENDDPAQVLMQRVMPQLNLLQKKIAEPVAPIIMPSMRPEGFYQGQYAQADEAYYPQHLFGVEVLSMYRAMPLSSYRFIKADPEDPKDFTVRSSVLEPMYYYQFMGYDDKREWLPFHKIVRPNSSFKWISTTKADRDIFGAHLWPLTNPKQPVGVILAGQRDVMAFHKLTGIPAGCFSAEGHYPTLQQVTLLWNLFERVYVLYDNDKTGRAKQAILTGEDTEWAAEHPEKPLYRFIGGLDILLQHFDPDMGLKLDVTKLLLSRPVAEHRELGNWWRQACGLNSL